MRSGASSASRSKKHEMMNQPEDLNELQRMRDRGNYEAIRRALRADWRRWDPFNEQTLPLLILAAEVCARDGDVEGIEQAIGPCVYEIGKVPFRLVARVMVTGAYFRRVRGEIKEGLELAATARKVAAMLDDEIQIAEALECEAELLRTAGSLEESIERFKEAKEYYQAQERYYRLGLSCSGIGKALIGLGRVEQARLALRGSVKTLSNCNDKLSLAVARTALAEALSTMGKYEQALGQLEQAYNEFEKLGRSEKALLTQASIGDVLVRMKKPEQAREPVEQAMTSAEATSGKVLSRLLQVQAHLCGLAGDWQNAETHARGAVAAAALSDDKTERALAAKALSRVYLSQGREVEAVAELSRALAEIKPGTKMILELEIKALLSRAIYPIDPQQAYRLINDVQEEIKGRDLPVLREACIEALARIEAGPPDNFFVLSDKPLPTLSVARDQLARWLVRRALSQSEGSADKAGEKLRITGTHIRNLLRRIREGKKLYRSADEGRRSKKSEPAQK